MSAPFTVDQAKLLAALDGIRTRAGNFAPVLPAIGSILVAEAQLCFREARDPWGAPWAPLAQATLFARAARRTGGKLFKRTGGLTKRAATIIATAKPGLDTGRLRNSLTYRVETNYVVVGTNVVYGGTFQFGATKGAFGATRRGAPIPWGNVPARPFLPVRAPGGPVDLPDGTRREIVAAMSRYVFNR